MLCGIGWAEGDAEKKEHTPRRTEPRRIHGRSLLSAGLSYTAYLGCATAVGCTAVVVVVAGYTDCTIAGERGMLDMDEEPAGIDVIMIIELMIVLMIEAGG